MVSLADGTELGSVEHVYLDPTRKLIVAFSFQSGGGLFGGKARSLVDVADVHAIGPDAITITDAAAVRSEMAIGDRCHGLIELDDLLKRKVMTERGEHLGQLTAIHFEQGSYRVSSIEVSHGRLHPETTSIPAAQLGQIGDDLILVTDPVPAPVMDQGASPVSSRRTTGRAGSRGRAETPSASSVCRTKAGSAASPSTSTIASSPSAPAGTAPTTRRVSSKSSGPATRATTSSCNPTSATRSAATRSPTASRTQTPLPRRHRPRYVAVRL
ncbi:MAG: hypothetical protein AVDCRST_MAG19-3930 [uncultured Thermomicrobiales bacterium]|uniref:PRC-barrel domain-containing protein n=1 Tax=uncultured Thermomicrobiales bacterium TaxID=1645740 RepID=A0A6J4VR19_9BACT|nr:MAG: hypothetical protein AVDCRST_MAG19-3930 [uncultured Thermomicrobiales bacterium]